MNENREFLLYKGIKNNGIVKYEHATSLYSNENSARSAIQALIMKGFLETTDVPGRFRVLKAPDSVKRMVKNSENSGYTKKVGDD